MLCERSYDAVDWRAWGTPLIMFPLSASHWSWCMAAHSGGSDPVKKSAGVIEALKLMRSRCSQRCIRHRPHHLIRYVAGAKTWPQRRHAGSLAEAECARACYVATFKANLCHVAPALPGRRQTPIPLIVTCA